MADVPTAAPSTGTVLADRGPRLVPIAISQGKFDQQIERWNANADAYARRGWLLLSVGDLSVEVGFLRNVAMGPRTIPVVTACVRIDYWNFDLWAPSVTFLDPIAREPTPPPVRAPDRTDAGEVRDALIDQHPTTLRPFLCLPGIREYHTHPQHSGDDWLLHRHLHAGDLVVICERIWRRMSRNVLGMSVAIQSLAPGSSAGIVNQLDMNLLQGDADLTQRQMAAQGAEPTTPPAVEGADDESMKAAVYEPASDPGPADVGQGPPNGAAEAAGLPGPVTKSEAVASSDDERADDDAPLLPAARRKARGGSDLTS